MSYPGDLDYRALKAHNQQVNLLESRAGAVELRSMPRFIMIELTQGYNLRCPMCRSRRMSYHERELDRGVLASLAEILFPTAEMVDVRGGGESLLA